MWLDLVLRWAHILSAAILIGGTFFLRFSLAPLLARQSAEGRQALLPLWRPGWARLVMITSGLLLVSGLFNLVRNIQESTFPDAPYHALGGIKLLLGLVVFWLSAVISGRSRSAEKFRERLTMWLNLNLVLIVLIVLIGGYMKSTRREPKPADNEPTASSSADVGLSGRWAG